MSSYELFRRAERVELLAAGIYEALASRFRADPEAQRLFARLSAEEHQHANRIRLFAAMYRKDGKLAPALAGEADLEACLAEAEGAYSRAVKGELGADLAAAKAEAAALEERLARAHAHALARDADPALLQFFRELAVQDGAHAELLR